MHAYMHAGCLHTYIHTCMQDTLSYCSRDVSGGARCRLVVAGAGGGRQGEGVWKGRREVQMRGLMVVHVAGVGWRV